MQLHREHQENGLALVTLNMEGEEKLEEAEVILREQEIVANNLILREGMTQDALDQLEHDGVLPAVHLYDRQGQLRHQLTGVIDETELDRFVLALLAEPAP